MGVELVRKHVSIALRNCYILASRHPLLVFMVFVLIWIYRSFPILFSLLVHASPVIASTLVLLGTLLYFGHENTPEIQKDGKPQHHEIGVIRDAEIGEEIYGARSKAIGENTYLVNNMHINDDHRGSMKLQQEAKSELGNQKTILGEEKVGLVNRCAQFQPSETKTFELRSDVNSRRNSFDTSHSALGHIDEDNKGWETGSDLVESSSPSASMADIFPMLDELHPLLESEIPQRTRMSNVITDAASDHSLESGEMINETDDYYDDDDDDDDDEDQEDIEVRDDEEENVITWTEDDERNVMNLGTSELERNQRLENLIARQKALKNMRMMAEKNMINFSPGLPFNSTPITIARKNPFDLPYESNENILGSAPSVILPRNPFDLPYNPSGQKPNRVEPTFQSDPVGFQTNDPFSRRHESFDVGPSTLGALRGRPGYNLGPYFVPERIASDPESVGSNHTEADSSREADLMYVRKGFHTSEIHDEVKISGGNEKGYESSSSSFFDVTDDIYGGDNDEEEEYRSIENSSTQDSNELQIEDSSVGHSAIGDSKKGGLPQRLSQVQHGLTSWLTGWKA